MALSTQPDQADQKQNPRVESPNKTYAAPAPAPEQIQSVPKDRSESVFGPGVTIEGKIEGDADVRIAGVFKGDIQIAGDVTIEKGAQLTAKINATTINVAGKIEGSITASSQVRLLESAQVIGDLKATTLTVAAGSRMRGHVEFGWTEPETVKLNGGRTQETSKHKPAG